MILTLLVALVAAVLIIWLIKYAAMQEPFRTLLIFVVIVLFLCWVFGLFGGSPLGLSRRGG